MSNMTTTYAPGASAYRKPFAWSYSKLKNFEVCPKKHYEVDVVKSVKEEESEALLWGNTLHTAAARRLDKGVKLPDGMELVEDWCKKIIGDGTSTILVEQQLAINKDFGKCDWFGKQAWYRAIVDVAKIMGEGDRQMALAIDWKTGKIKEDGVQLALTAACIFAHHPGVQKIRTHFVWVAHGADTRADFAREDMPGMWRSIWPRIEQLKHAYDTTSYPAKPGGLCKRWCPVDTCPHHGG